MDGFVLLGKNLF